jgi:hypothetical protein
MLKKNEAKKKCRMDPTHQVTISQYLVESQQQEQAST